jgi:hypothetical protein
MMMTPCVTVTGTETLFLLESVQVRVVLPAASAVTVIFAVGPFGFICDNETTPVGLDLIRNRPLYLASLNVSVIVGAVAKLSFVGFATILTFVAASALNRAPATGAEETGGVEPCPAHAASSAAAAAAAAYRAVRKMNTASPY